MTMVIITTTPIGDGLVLRHLHHLHHPGIIQGIIPVTAITIMEDIMVINDD